ncbi:unnamed protein product [Ambrosiozyma monospora]|uniref:Unnamed protein product n=1 Tax=Ambrosiozyma monospora TaxID=43982 RepID=A0ACB5T1Z0_AMBMO|nr:unnamed protein product [Ambrosiozyma monospora]
MSSSTQSTSGLFETEVLKVNPASIHFTPNNSTDYSELKIDDPETKINLEKAAKILTTTNEVVGFPTETVYGLGAPSKSSDSVRSIYRAKNRPLDNPLITHISSLDQLYRTVLPNGASIPKQYEPLIEKFWPGPLTILLPVPETSNDTDSTISNLVTANQPTFAVRMPSHPVARALIAISDTPLAAPSANASTRPSPTQASHVLHDLKGKIPLILDGGSCDVGLESTVVDGLCDPPMLLRPGGVSLEDLKTYGGEFWSRVVVAKRTAGKLEPVRTPGMKYRHYSPVAKVYLFLQCGDGVEKLNEFIDQNDLKGKKIALLRSKHFNSASEISSTIIVDRELGKTGDDIQRHLFAMLREVDELGVDVIFVEGVDNDHEGLAIMNRLQKAAYQTVKG